MAASRPYRVRDALLGLFVGLWLTGLPGFGLYAMSPERLRCERDGAEVICRLGRWVLGVPMRAAVLHGVRGATLEEYYSAPKAVFTRRDPGGVTYHLRYDTANGPFDGVEGPDRHTRQAMVDGLRTFLSGGDATYEHALPAGPLVWRLALALLFVVGALCLVNIPFAAFAELRRRAAPSAASPPTPGGSRVSPL